VNPHMGLPIIEDFKSPTTIALACEESIG
jgi:hypothetical protein